MKPERVALIVVVLAAVVFVVSQELSASEGSDCMGTITSDPSTWPTGDKIWNFSRAVGFAEGANVPGSIPDTYNNPGDLTQGDEWGQEVSGYGQGSIIQFASKQGGWNALYAKLQNILSGNSGVYCQDWTISEIASHWTATDPADWATNVAAELNVPTSTTLDNYVNG